MINAAYYGNPLIFIVAIRLSLSSVSDTVFDMVNAIYHDKLLIFIGAMFREKFVSLHWAVNEGCF